MKKLVLLAVALVFLMLTEGVSGAWDRIIIAPDKMPMWVLNAEEDGALHWSENRKDGEFAYGVGVGFTTKGAIDEACRNAYKETTYKTYDRSWCHNREAWRKGGKLYIIVRIHINIIPAER